VRVQVARSRREILRCQQLIAEVYNKEYEVVFSEDRYDLDAKVEPWPHRYIMALAEQELVAAIGLYLRDTYVERFGDVSQAEIERLLVDAGASGRYAPARKREITKVSVRHDRRGRGYGRFLLTCAHSRDFLELDSPPAAPNLLVCCARRSIWDNMWGKSEIRTRRIKEFPFYKVHELYRSAEDPMDSRLIIPELDVPQRYYERRIPGQYEVER
jgi:GNAT superfamily N-acetyltransferase